MKADSVHHHDYDGKKVDRCKYIVTKTKPVFDWQISEFLPTYSSF
jgi:hypothetical protein